MSRFCHPGHAFNKVFMAKRIARDDWDVRISGNTDILNLDEKVVFGLPCKKLLLNITHSLLDRLSARTTTNEIRYNKGKSKYIY